MAKKSDLDFLELFIKDLTKEVKTAVKKELPVIAAEIHKNMKERSVVGLGVNKAGNASKYKSLKESTKKARMRKEKQGKLSNLTTANTSNQIETGQMIMKSKVKVKKSDMSIDIVPPTNRTEIAEYQEEMGRTSFALTNKQVAKMIDDVEEVCDKVLKELLKDF